MYRNKEVKVTLSEEANLVYNELNKIVGEERQKGVISSFHQTYSIQGNQIEIITFVMSIFNHKDYDKIFGYKH